MYFSLRCARLSSMLNKFIKDKKPDQMRRFKDWRIINASFLVAGTCLTILIFILACRDIQNERPIIQPGTINETDTKYDPNSSRPVVEIPFVSGWTTQPIACVYKAGCGKRRMEQSTDIIVAVWKNGQIIWSDDAVNGGAPYRIGKIEIKKVDAVLDGFEKEELFNNSNLSIHNYGPDSAFIVIAIMDRGRCLNMNSWHELFEDNPNLVATSEGITTLEGHERDEILAAEPDAYRYYRKVWMDVRSALADLIPGDGEIAPEIHFKLSRIKCEENE